MHFSEPLFLESQVQKVLHACYGFTQPNYYPKLGMKVPYYQPFGKLRRV
jgi:hypothetical protein